MPLGGTIVICPYCQCTSMFRDTCETNLGLDFESMLCKKCGKPLYSKKSSCSWNFTIPNPDKTHFPLLAFEPQIASELSCFREIVATPCCALQTLTDDRAVILEGALIIENSVRKFLKTAVPGRKKNLGFALAISLSRDMQLCPDQVFDDADLVREIRNEYAHDLTKRSYHDLSKKYRDSVGLRAKGYGSGIFQHSVLKEFCNLVMGNATSIFALASQTHKLRKFINDKRLGEYVKDWYKSTDRHA